MILNEIAIIDTTKSMGTDSVHPRTLHETRKKIAEELYRLMRSFWDAGEFQRKGNVRT